MEAPLSPVRPTTVKPSLCLAVLTAFAERQQRRFEAGLLSPHTLTSNVRTTANWRAFLAGVKEAHLPREFIAGYVAFRRPHLHSASMRVEVQVFYSAWSWAANENLVPANYFPPRCFRELVPRGEPVRPRRRLTPDEVKRLLAVARPRWRGLWGLMIATGMRLTEAVTLKWRHVDETTNTIHVVHGKTGSRTVTVPAETFRHLPRHGEPDEWVFPGLEAHGHVGHSSVLNALRVDLKHAGIPRDGLSPHALRHTACSQWMDAGATLRELQELGGWKTATVPLQVYSHARPERLQEVARRAIGLPPVNPN